MSANLLMQGQIENALTLHRRGAVAEAERAYQAILLLQPRNPAAAHGLGLLYLQHGQPERAEPLLCRAAELQPGNPSVHHDRGLAFRALNRLEEAHAAFDRAIALAPAFAAAHHGRGTVLLGLDQPHDAIESFSAAISFKPDFVAAWNERANALRALNRLEEAISDYQKALGLNPDNPAVLCNLGFALQDLGRFDESLQAYNRAIALAPDFHLAHRSRGTLKLLLGQMREGFADFEWRLRAPASLSHAELQSIPYWRGEELREKSIVVYSDGAFGDLVQFGRYLPLLTAQGASVALLAPAKFHPVLATESLGVRSVSSLEDAGAIDFRCELMSLPFLFGTDIGTIPPAVSLIAGDRGRVDRWRARLPNGTFNIGICWQGNPARHIDRGRSIPLAEFEPLARMQGVRLISLQKHHGLEQLQSLPSGMRIETFDDLDEGPYAFVETAALIQGLDLIVTSDTAVAHLAAALGTPTWIALRYIPEWRWLLDRSDSPWYPTVRLFRQRQLDQWSAVFEHIATALGEVVESRPRGRA